MNIDIDEVIKDIKQKMTDPEFAKTLIKRWADRERLEENTRRAQEDRVRELAASRGYRIMHRGKGRYWLMIDKPMSLDVIRSWIDQQSK